MYQQKRREKRYQSTGKLPGTLLTRDGRIRLENCTVCEISSRGICILSKTSISKGSILVLKLGSDTLALEVVYCNYEIGSEKANYRIGMFLRQEKAVLLEKLQANGLDVDIPKRKIA